MAHLQGGEGGGRRGGAQIFVPPLAASSDLGEIFSTPVTPPRVAPPPSFSHPPQAPIPPPHLHPFVQTSHIVWRHQLLLHTLKYGALLLDVGYGAEDRPFKVLTEYLGSMDGGDWEA